MPRPGEHASTLSGELVNLFRLGAGLRTTGQGPVNLFRLWQARAGFCCRGAPGTYQGTGSDPVRGVNAQPPFPVCAEPSGQSSNYGYLYAQGWWFANAPRTRCLRLSKAVTARHPNYDPCATGPPRRTGRLCQRCTKRPEEFNVHVTCQVAGMGRGIEPAAAPQTYGFSH